MSTSRNASATRSALKLALLADKLRARGDELQVLESEPIAIIGMGCRIPGGAQSPSEFWDLLMRGVDAITEVPPSRWDSASYFDPNPEAPGKITTRFGGFLRDIEYFDPMVFGIAPKEAAYMDPQQRLLLEVAWEAFNDAGYPLEQLRRTATGVYFAVGSSDYSRLQLGHPADISAHTLSGTQGNMASGRLSYLFDLRGPSVVVDTACSSSLVAIHLAVQSLRRGESNLAIAGGVNVNLLPEISISLAKWGMVAPDGRCKTFDERADGFIRSEGCGAVVLKRLSDALRDRDPIQAVIRASAINQDGRSNVLTAPNGAAQRELLRSALRQAQVAAADVTFVETHGTGTKVGDPIEVEALAEVLGQPRDDGSVCYLGAVKANVGHLEAAAGVTGMVKTVLCLRNRKIPPQVHFRKLNPLISLDDTVLRIPTTVVDWETGGKSRFAGVSSFGFSGTNAHLILEEAPKLPAPSPPERAELLVISAKSEGALAGSVDRYAEFLARPDGPSVTDICFTAAARRHHYRFRTSAVGKTHRELIERLRVSEPEAEANDTALAVAFIYSGQGSGWSGMGAALLRDEPVCRDMVERCDNLLRESGADWSVHEALAERRDASWMNDTAKYQIALFVLQAALTEVWRSWGLRPTAVLGHSIGEIGAAYAAGALTLEQALRVVACRGRVMRAHAPSGAMAVLGLPLRSVEALLGGLDTDLVIAAHNGPDSVTVAGARDDVDALLARPELRGEFARRLEVDHAFHSPAMERAAAAFVDEVRQIAAQPPSGVRMFSSVAGREIALEALTLDYWRKNIRDRVRFADAAQGLLAAGFTAFVEIGPHPGLLATFSALAGGRATTTLPSLRRDQDARTVMLESLATLYRAGLPVEWNSVHNGNGRCVSPLPVYAWQRDRYWFEPRAARPAVTATGVAGLLGRRIESAFSEAIVFDTALSPTANEWLTDHRVGGVCVVPGAAFVEMALEAAAEVLGTEAGIELSAVVIERPLVLPEGCPRQVQVGATPSSAGRLSIRVASRALDSTEAWITHFECTAGRVGAAVSGSSIGAPIRVQPSKTSDLDAMYARLAERGLDFGVKFRCLAELWYDARESRATLVPERDRPRGFLLFPPRLDACLHALEPYFASSDDAWLPVEVERVVWSRPGSLTEVHTRVREPAGSRADDIRTDLTLYDEGGQPFVTIDGFRLKRAPADALARIASYSIDDSLHEWRWERDEVVPNGSVRGAWLVICDDGPVGTHFARLARDSGATCSVVTAGTQWRENGDGSFAMNLADPEHYRRVVAACKPASGSPWTVMLLRGEVRGPAGDGNPLVLQDDVLRPALWLVQALAREERASLWLVTSGAQLFPTAEGVRSGTLWGFGAVLDHEYPGMHCRLIDLDAGDTPIAQAEALAREAANASAPFENRIAWSDGARHVARLRRLRQTSGGPLAWVLRAPSSGMLTDLSPDAIEAPEAGPGEVLVEPRAIGLNFRDVLTALGMLSDGTPVLGGECSGRVVAVGSGVDPGLIGRAVIAYSPHCFASPTVIPAALVAPIPTGMGFVEAASLPVAFLTAKYGLESCAALRAGERVLIHAAAGGVGLAAVQVARKRGAEIFATAGSARKQEYLRALGVQHVFSSRTTGFKDEILRVTGGKGVDVVLNSLADEFITASFDVLGRNGRFIELGKRGIWSATRAAARRPDAGYFAFDLSDVAAERPGTIGELLAQMLAELESGALAPVPWRGYDLDDLQRAFDYMARARHVGKLVIAIRARAEPVAEHGTYLIAGAAAGLAPPLARTLARRGAKHLLFLSRSAPDERLLGLMQELRVTNVAVQHRQADIGSREQLRAALDSVRGSMPPLSGVFHLAGVLDDGPIATQTWERFRGVMAAKIGGASNLDELTADSALSHFVLYSSTAAVLGWRGQSSYASGNGFMDALARRRAARGLAGLSINWGPWSEAGMAAATAASKGVDFGRWGLSSFSTEEGTAALGVLLQSSADQAVAARIDFSKMPEGSLTRTGDRAARSVTAAVEALHDVLREIGESPPGQRRALLRQHVEKEAARALGLKPGYRFSGTRPLNELGLDSLLAVQLANALGASLSRPMTATLVFDYPTIDGLVEYLAGTVIGERPDGESARPVPAETELANISDSDAESLLRQELASVRSLDARK